MVQQCHKGTEVHILKSNFSHNAATTGYGGVIYQAECNVNVSKSYFINNSGELGGVLYNSDNNNISDTLVWEDSYFSENWAKKGGVAFVSRSILSTLRCLFTFNKADLQGGALFITVGTHANITSTNFTNNRAKEVGGAIRAINNTNVLFSKYVLFENNSAYYGAAIHLYSCDQLTFNTSAFVWFTRNNATYGVLLSIDSKVNFNGETMFTDNFGSLYIYGSSIYMWKSVTFLNSHMQSEIEGCITLLLSKLVILTGAKVRIMNNTAQNGGGLLALSSNIDIFESTVDILDNTASGMGGGMYLYQSKLYIEGDVRIRNNHANLHGGGIHAMSTAILIHSTRTLTVTVRLILDSNTASKGGGA